MTRILWLTDVHYMTVGGINGHDPRARLAAVVEKISADFSDADAVLITGDVTEHGQPEDYEGVRAAMAELPMPVHYLVGNHDDRDVMAQHLPPPPDAQDGFRQFAVQLGDSVLLCLDSLETGHQGGRLCADRLAWVDAALHAAGEARVIVAVHHPPVSLGLPLQDVDKIAEGDALMQRLAQHARVAHVLCGHVHRPITVLGAGVPVSSMSAIAYQAPSPWPPWTWDTFEPPVEPPAFGVIDLGPDTLTIHTVQFCAAGFGVEA